MSNPTKNTVTNTNTNNAKAAQAMGVKVSGKLELLDAAIAELADGSYCEATEKDLAGTYGVPIGIVKIRAMMQGQSLRTGRTAVATLDAITGVLGGRDGNDDKIVLEIAEELGLKTTGTIEKIMRDNGLRDAKRRSASSLPLDQVYREYLRTIVEVFAGAVTRPHNSALFSAVYAITGSDKSLQSYKSQIESNKDMVSFAGERAEDCTPIAAKLLAELEGQEDNAE
jgi:hypothetical protein